MKKIDKKFRSLSDRSANIFRKTFDIWKHDYYKRRLRKAYKILGLTKDQIRNDIKLYDKYRFDKNKDGYLHSYPPKLAAKAALYETALTKDKLDKYRKASKVIS